MCEEIAPGASMVGMATKIKPQRDVHAYNDSFGYVEGDCRCLCGLNKYLQPQIHDAMVASTAAVRDEIFVVGDFATEK